MFKTKEIEMIEVEIKYGNKFNADRASGKNIEDVSERESVWHGGNGKLWNV